MIDLIRKAATRAYSRFLFWWWDREIVAAEQRFRGCTHEHTMFVDVGSPPYDCVEKCLACWALRVPKLSDNAFDAGAMEWTPNAADPRRACEVAPPNARVP